MATVRRRFDHVVGAVVEHDHAAVRKPAARARGTAQQRGLGIGLGDQRARRERRHLHHTGERGPSRRGVEQVVRRAPVAVEPAAPADAARRHAAARHLERVQDASVKRALHVDRPRRPTRAADREVARAVDRKAVVRGQRVGEYVGEQALREAAGVELDARGARHARRARVHVDLAPARAPARGAGRSLGGERERELQRQWPAQVAHVADVLDLVEQRAVHQPFRAHRREHHRFGQPRHQRAHSHGARRVLVEQRQLAVGQKARELVVPFAQAPLGSIGSLARQALWQVAFHQHLARGAKASEGAPRLHGHDCDVVTADGLLVELDSELFSPALDSELEPVLVLRSDELEVAAALRLAAAASAGS
jgi:hypothetical protein